MDRQGIRRRRGAEKLSRRTFARHLEATGGLQLDSINVVCRAHYLTLWSRFGSYEPSLVDRWSYGDRVGYEYWGHEASILPISHLPVGFRRMRKFPTPRWKNSSWWKSFQTSTASRRRVLRRLRDEGPLESVDFEPQEHETRSAGAGVMPLAREDKRSLRILWHEGRIAVHGRRHFRRVYDLAERVYPEVEPASVAEYEDSWLLAGLRGNGIASEAHLVNYITGPKLGAVERRRVLARNLARGTIVEVDVEGLPGPFYARPEDLDGIGRIEAPEGTTLLCPFDSLLWQRQRAEDLLGFRYRIEIYVPPARRVHGYYVLPILHDGELVGRLDPKFHRDRGELEVKSIDFEKQPKHAATVKSRRFKQGLADAIDSLAGFIGADTITMPSGVL